MSENRTIELITIEGDQGFRVKDAIYLLTSLLQKISEEILDKDISNMIVCFPEINKPQLGLKVKFRWLMNDESIL